MSSDAIISRLVRDDVSRRLHAAVDGLPAAPFDDLVMALTEETFCLIRSGLARGRQ